jgi:Ca-activated chloride channel family protein
MGRLWSRIQNPAIENLCVDWGMDAEFYPEIIPDLYAGEPLWLHARLPHHPGDISVCGELDGRYWETRVPVQAGDGSGELAALWARSKVEALEDSRIFGAAPNDIREAVLDVALEHGLLTAYTSLVAVDRTPARPRNASLQDERVPGLLPAGSSASTGFAQTGSGWVVRALLCLFSLLAATGMLLYIPPSRARSSAEGGRQPAVRN